MLTDPSKAFDYISHELLIAKLNANRFDKKSLDFILAYFINRKQKTKIRYGFSGFISKVFIITFLKPTQENLTFY